MSFQTFKSYNVLSEILLLVGYSIPLEELKKWKKRQRVEVERWASRTYLRASDNLVHVPRKPSILNKYTESR